MPKRWLVLLLAVLLGAATSVLLVVSVGLQQIQQTQRSIVQEAFQKGLTAVAETAVYAGEKEYRVVRGWDAEGREKWVWFNEEEWYEIETEGLLASEEARLVAQRLYPDGRLVRLTPGLFKQRPVWVAFLQDHSTQQYVYLYLQMTDGAVIRELRLH